MISFITVDASSLFNFMLALLYCTKAGMSPHDVEIHGISLRPFPKCKGKLDNIPMLPIILHAH